MTDNNIIKALECCINGKCNGCPLYAMNCSPKVAMAFSANIINRQKAEIERLQSALIERRTAAEKKQYVIEGLSDEITWLLKREKTAKAEAIKEFAERLKTEIADALKSNYRAKTEHIEKHYKCLSCDLLAMIRGKIDALRGIDDYIDNLVKEMVGERE